MWRVSLSLITHRFFLLVVALSAINLQILSKDTNVSAFSIQPVSKLMEGFVEKVSASKEATEIKGMLDSPVVTAFSKSKDPFLWLGRIFSGLFSISPAITVLILSNIFLILFLSELYSLVNLMALPDVAVDTCVLAILWLTSYELSVGSSLSLSCFLSSMIIRHAMDNRWLMGGLGLGLLALTKPFALFLIPLLVLVFWNQQRHFAPSEISRRAAYFVIPVTVAVFFNWGLYQNMSAIVLDSALFNLIDAAKQQQNFTWTVSQSYLGQSIAILILLLGTIASFFIFSTLLHRVLPLALFLALLVSTPYRDIATSALLVAPAFSGIAEGSASGLLKTVQAFFLLIGAVEVFRVF